MMGRFPAVYGVPLPVGQPPVNWETLRLAGLLLGERARQPAAESTGPDTVVPERPKQRRPLPPTKGRRPLAWEE